MEKYLVASSGDTLDSKVSGRFGHSGYFLVVDPQTLDFEAFQGINKDEYQHIDKFIKPGIKKVIVGNIGPSAYNEVISFGCTIYLCLNMKVIEAIKKVEVGDILPLKEPTIKDSIHSARKAGDGYGGRGAGIGKGMGLGPRDGRGQGRGMGMGKGQGKGMGGGRGNR